MVIWLFLGGIVGAWLFFVVQYYDHFESFGQLFNITQGGLVYYGGIVGGLAAFALYVRLRPVPVLVVGDVLAPAIMLGQGLGRVGCFLNGCCYGDESHLPWAIAFPHESIPYVAHVQRGLIDASATQSLPVYSTQLYSAAGALVICALLVAYYPFRRRDGAVFGLLLVTYPVMRFLVEYLRDDELALATGLTISQNISLLVLTGGIVYWLWRRSRPALVRADIPGGAPTA